MRDNYGGLAVNKGDLFTVDLDGQIMTVFVLGSYQEENSGETMLILAVVNQDNLLHVSAEDLDRLFSIDEYCH